MKALKLFSWIIAFAIIFGCNKNNSSAPNAAMTASVGGNAATFTGSTSGSNGYTVFEGSGTVYTIQLWLKISGAGTYILGAPSSGYYATIQDNFGTTYTTNAVNDMGSVTLTATSGGPNLYNGSFYFTAASSSGNTLVVSSGSFSDM